MREYIASERSRIDTRSHEFKKFTDYQSKYEISMQKGIFGANFLQTFDKLRNTNSGKEKELLDQMQNQLFDIVSKLDSQKLIDFVLEIFSDQDLIEEMVVFLKQKGIIIDEETCDVPLVVSLFERNPEYIKELSSSFIEKIIRIHVEGREIYQIYFESQEFPAIIENVNKKITHAIETGLIPISLEYWNEMKNKMVIFLSDPLFETGFHGAFNLNSGIQVSQELSEEAKEHVIIHEFLHSLGGKTVDFLLTQTQFYDNVEIDERIALVRAGLRFNSDFEMRTRERFQWLDEAVTEDLTIEIDGKGESEIYVPERRLFAYLLKYIGTEQKVLFKNAYFEDFSPTERDPKKRLEHYKKLTAAIAEKLGDRFLVQLDMFIYEQRDPDGNVLPWREGVEIAVVEWEKRGSNFPQFLEHWVETRSKKFLLVSQNIVKQFNKLYPGFFSKEIKSSHFNDLFEKLWERYFMAQVPHRSKYELTVIKQFVKERLLREKVKAEKTKVKPLINLSRTKKDQTSLGDPP